MTVKEKNLKYAISSRVVVMHKCGSIDEISLLKALTYYKTRNEAVREDTPFIDSEYYKRTIEKSGVCYGFSC